MKDSDDKVQDVEEDWVFDSLVNFLHGPIWKMPVIGFLEEKSVVFDPDSYNSMTSEKEVEYRKIHEDYKRLVDFMLTSFMEDIQVTSEQVEDACRIREHTKQSQSESSVTRNSLEQLWAAEDFNAFRRLMTRKNIDLQLQSLELLVSKYGVLSPALRNSTGDADQGDGEEEFLQVVIRYADPTELFEQSDSSTSNIEDSESSDYQSLHHIVSTRNQNQLTKQLLTIKALVSPPQPQTTSTSDSLQPVSQIRKQEEAEKCEDILKRNQQESGDVSGPTSTKVELNRVIDEDDAKQQFSTLASLKRALEMPQGEGGLAVQDRDDVASSADIRERRDYMRAQRDKLVALKRSEREKLLANESRGGSSRPKSSRAAHMALTSLPNSKSNEKSLAARRAIAERLRQELIEKSD